MKNTLRRKTTNYQIINLLMILGMFVFLTLGCSQINDAVDKATNANATTNSNTTVNTNSNANANSNANSNVTANSNANANTSASPTNSAANANFSEKTVNESQEDTTPNLITTYTMTDKVNSDASPIGEKSIFSPKDKIYLTFNVKNLKSGTKFRFNWKIDGKAILEADLPIDKDYKSVFVQSKLEDLKNYNPQMAGEVEVYMNDKLLKTLQFTIKE